jgi:hypothetical protein
MMSMGGKIFGADQVGNAKVMPAAGGRPVILRGSAGKGFRQGDYVLYDDIIPGKNVDFSEDYKLPVQTRNAPPGSVPGALASRIRSVLSRHTLCFNSVIIAYDPGQTFTTTRSGNGHDAMAWFHYLAMARDMQAADAVVGQINTIFTPLGTYGIIHAEGTLAGRQGALLGVRVARFAERTSKLSHPALAVVPMLGIVSHIDGDALISVPVMETCLQQAAIVLDSVARH